MTPTQLKDLFRGDVRDESSPFLWSDTEIFIYMDDAQKMFCRLTGGIADSTTTDIVNIAVTANVNYATYDPRILKLRDLRRASDGRNVSIINFEALSNNTSSDYGQATGSAGRKFTTEPRVVSAAITGMDANRLRFLAPPLANETLNAIVYRLPLADITSASTAIEIDPQHHRPLLHWMKHLAHEKQDAETYDRGRSLEFLGKFTAYCSDAKAERERREHTYRAMSYGGI